MLLWQLGKKWMTVKNGRCARVDLWCRKVRSRRVLNILEETTAVVDERGVQPSGGQCGGVERTWWIPELATLRWNPY